MDDGVAVVGARFADCAIGEASFVDADLRDADFSGSDLTRTTFRGCALSGCDFQTSSGLFFEPSQNRSKDALISVETAVHLAQAAGLRVAGHDDGKKATKGATKKRR